MSVNLTIAGGTYPYPSESTDTDWGDEATAAIQQLSAQAVYLSTVQTITNKTLTSPAIATPAITGGTIASPTVSGVSASGTNISTSNKAVDSALFDANTILAANSDNTPAAVTVAEQTLLGRITGGNISALTLTQLSTLLGAITTGYGLVPPGTIQNYVGAAAPTGWILATASTPESIGSDASAATLKGTAYLALYAILWDTATTDDTGAHKISSAKGASASADFSANKIITIDYKGSFLRAIGTGTGYTETTLTAAGLGLRQNDAEQGHHHYVRDLTVGATTNLGIQDTAAAGGTGGIFNTDGQLRAHEMLDDGTNGTPRIAKETRPKNIGVNLIIKY